MFLYKNIILGPVWMNENLTWHSQHLHLSDKVLPPENTRPLQITQDSDQTSTDVPMSKVANTLTD